LNAQVIAVDLTSSSQSNDAISAGNGICSPLIPSKCSPKNRIFWQISFVDIPGAAILGHLVLHYGTISTAAGRFYDPWKEQGQDIYGNG